MNLNAGLARIQLKQSCLMMGLYLSDTNQNFHPDTQKWKFSKISMFLWKLQIAKNLKDFVKI